MLLGPQPARRSHERKSQQKFDYGTAEFSRPMTAAELRKALGLRQ
jgi:hypothetical protein